MVSSSLPAVIDQLGATPPPGQWTESDRPQQVAFREALATSGSVRDAARQAGISYRTAYRARRSQPTFRQAWQGALLASRPVSEDVLTTRAIDGVEEQVFYHGEVIATRVRYDSRLLLAHLGRLDKLCEDADAGAFAEDFDGALERFAAGEELAAPEAGNSSPAQCDKCDKSNSAPAGATPGPEAASEAEPARGPDLQWCEHAGAMLPRVDRLLNAMDAARPAGARLPDQFGGYRAGEVEAEQMAAFEAGAERWWLVVPPSPDDDPAEWTHYEDCLGAFEALEIEYKSLELGLANGGGEPGGAPAQSSSASSTRPLPRAIRPICAAADFDRSSTRPRANGPRSLMRTTTDLPLAGLVTRTIDPSGSVRCAAVSRPGLNRSPLAVRWPASSLP